MLIFSVIFLVGVSIATALGFLVYSFLGKIIREASKSGRLGGNKNVEAE
jgi:hypothetical protein